MEASALWISHSSSVSGIALLSGCSGNKLCRWQFSFKKPSPSVHSDSGRRVLVKNVASRKQTKKLEDPPALEQGKKGVALDALRPDSASIASSIKYHAEFTPLFSPELFELPKAYYATAESAYYLSMEYLQGRALLNAIGNLELTGAYAEALKKLGHNLEDVAGQEPDAALGNGGLGRLASCFLDSMATLNYPAWGYGLRYRYGLFKQLITKDGQEEVAENWLEMGNPWEIVRNDISYPVKFYGKVVEGSDGRKQWVGGEDIIAVAYDVPIPGYKTKTTINLRLWSTKVAADVFDLHAFNAGEHAKAYEAMKRAEKDIIARFERRSGDSVNWEKFPEKVAVQMNDTHPTLCIPELIRILIDVKGLSWKEAWGITQRTVAYTNHTVLPEALEKWSLSLLQELLPRHVEIIRMIDEELINTIIQEHGTEDLELLKEKLKQMRILDNIELPSAVLDSLVKSQESLIDNAVEVEEEEEDAVSDEVTKPANKEEAEEPSEEDKEAKVPKAEDPEKKVKSTFEPDPNQPQLVRMANLCVVAGHAVNGVAEIHSDIVKKEVFNEFYKLWPEKFQNKTNGVTPRRWIGFCNPELSGIITKWTGSEDWLINTEKLAELRKFADNEELQSEWREVKMNNKKKIVSFLKEKTGYVVSPDAMFDVQHELSDITTNVTLDILKLIPFKMKEMSAEERKAKFVPRVCIFGGKAFATYVQAKRIVKFITDVGATINHDPEIGDLLKVVFVPDYNVSVAEVLIPGSELSQHISTAGMEASGTSNMKFSMNGCILIGTLDGANVEIREEVGENNFFSLGARADEIAGLRKERAEGKFVPDPRFEEVKAFVRTGVFGPYNYEELMGSLEGNEGYGRADYFLVGKDFPSYIECQDKVDEAYRDQRNWTKMSILNTAGSFKFSSDRTIHQYARDIWMIEPLVLP
ncbi:UNVERIFIED_CONTAM: Alpha-1,4 glucan phosphorylase L-2 isozyme, chloroplastic/amyloplastic [Sesamum angustifolium]|uniref:Alpha-1,4 glucan phosphorylase n=1 Tax=Sesamum angustifolium TaxID=2727405 RepID=A0AAW2Q7Y8_9LAMI